MKSTLCIDRSESTISLPSHQSAVSLSEQMKKMYEQAAALHAIYQAVSKQPARAGCAAICMGVGVYEIFSGNYVSGAIATGSAAIEISHLFQDGVSSDLQRAFEDIDADVGIIQELQEANAVSYQTIQQQLQTVDGGIKDLQNELAAIVGLHGEGLSDFEDKRKETALLNQEATAAYEKASLLFRNAQEKMSVSKDSYQKCKQAFHEIQQIVTDLRETEQTQVAAQKLLDAAGKASHFCDEGKDGLDESNDLMKQAFEQLQAAHALKDKAKRSADRLMQKAEDSLCFLVEKIELMQTCSKAIGKAQEELDKVQKRHNQIMKLIEALKRDIRIARELAESRWTTMELASGMGAAVCFATAGPLSAVVIGGAAAYAVHHRSSLFSAASSIYHWAVGTVEPLKKPMEESECLRMEFSETSSGYWGYFVEGRPSVTVGMVHIHLGKGEVRSLPFDVRQEDKISKLDTLELLQLMNTQIAEGKLQSERCLAILDQLTSSENNLVREDSELHCVIDLLRERCLSS